MIRLLVIGYGSIGARHARLAAEMGAAVACVTHNPECLFAGFSDVPGAIRGFGPTHAIVATSTADHAADLSRLRSAGFNGPVLVEKPLFAEAPTVEPSIDTTVFVGYNLRFHPLIDALRDAVRGRRLIMASLHAGQYLPDWRPSADYRTSYSADQSRGGGVLRDLSHELDLAIWLLGPWRRVAALGGKFGDLDITSDDTMALVAEMQRCPVLSLTLNYHDRMPQRRISLNADGVTATVDLIAGRLVVNGVVHEIATERDETYRLQLAAFMSGTDDRLATMADGLDVDHWRACIERSRGTAFVEASPPA